MNHFAALLKRELWEHRALIYMPLALAGVIIVSAALLSGQAISSLGDLRIDLFTSRHGDLEATLGSFSGGLALAFMFVSGWVVIVYLVDCLKADRDDRSILFWKSLPVSDMETVLSKLATATIVAPLIAAATGFLCLITLLIIASITLSLADIGTPSALWTHTPFMAAAGRILYAIPVQALWFLPLTSWLLVVSALANRAVWLWVVLPPVVLIWAESLLFGTRSIATFIGAHLHGVFPVTPAGFREAGAHFTGIGGFSPPGLSRLIDPTAYLQRPELWQGVVVGVILLAVAIWLRRYHDEGL